MNSLRVKLIGGFLALLAMIVSVALYSSFSGQKSLRDSIGQGSIFVANEMLVNMNMAVLNWIDRFETRAMDPLIRETVELSNRQFAAAGAASPVARRTAANPASEELRALFVDYYQKKDGTQPVVQIVVTNRAGATVAATAAEALPRYDGDALWIAAKSSGSQVGDTAMDEASGQSFVPLAVPIFDAQGGFEGMLMVRLSADSIIRNAVITYKKYETTQVRVTTREGKLVYSSKAFRFMDDVSNASYVRQMKGDTGTFQSVEAGRPTLYSYARSTGYLTFTGIPWTIILGNDVSEVLAPSLTLRNNIIIASAVLLAIGMCLALVISRSITRPIAKLNEIASEIARGNLGQVIEIKGRDEVARLAQSFADMQEALRGIAALAERISAGDLDVEAVKRSPDDRLGLSLEMMVDNLRRISAFAERLAAGDLSVASVKRSEEDRLGISLENLLDNLRRISDFSQSVAAGDLTVQSIRRSEVDSLGISLEGMLQNLRHQTGEIQGAANVLASAASEIFTSATQFAANSNETASAVSQTTTTIEEVKQTAHQSNERARQMAARARTTDEIAQAGIVSVQETTRMMAKIRGQMDTIGASIVRLSEQGASIGEITSTVSDLADQSNLLAVNAAIEAAKAGEHGRGFGVVAQEIRSLAEQSKVATSQVRAILTEIQRATTAAVLAAEQGSKSVEQGEAQAGEARASIESLAKTVAEASQGAALISASSQQQLAGMDQVVVAMESIKAASVQGVAGTRQLETGAQNLNAVGQKMKQLLELYKI
jgi:methyl-accepting chemotaxis protein